MPIRVSFPGHGIVEFPDGTSEDVMRGALKKLNASADAPNAAEMLTRTGRGQLNTQEKEREPDTWGGGFVKGLKEYFAPAGKELMEEALPAMAHPQDKGDFAGLLVPGAGPAIINDIRGGTKVIGRALGNAASEATARGGSRVQSVSQFPKIALRELAGEFNRPELKGPKRAQILEARDALEYPTAGVGSSLDEIGNSVPPAKQKMPMGDIDTIQTSEGDKFLGVDPNRTSRSGYRNAATDTNTTSGELPQSTASMVDPYMPNKSGYSPTDRGIDMEVPAGAPAAVRKPRAKTVKVDRYMPNQSGFEAPTQSPIEEFLLNDIPARTGGEGRMTGQFEEGAGGLTDVMEGNVGAPRSQSFQDTMRSTEPEMGWHSGAQKGSADAKRAEGQHRYAAEMDADYRRGIESDDILKMIMAALSGGAATGLPQQ